MEPQTKLDTAREEMVGLLVRCGFTETGDGRWERPGHLPALPAYALAGIYSLRSVPVELRKEADEWRRLHPNLGKEPTCSPAQASPAWALTDAQIDALRRRAWQMRGGKWAGEPIPRWACGGDMHARSVAAWNELEDARAAAQQALERVLHRGDEASSILLDTSLWAIPEEPLGADWAPDLWEDYVIPQLERDQSDLRGQVAVLSELGIAPWRMYVRYDVGVYECPASHRGAWWSTSTSAPYIADSGPEGMTHVSYAVRSGGWAEWAKVAQSHYWLKMLDFDRELFNRQYGYAAWIKARRAAPPVDSRGVMPTTATLDAESVHAMVAALQDHRVRVQASGTTVWLYQGHWGDRFLSIASVGMPLTDAVGRSCPILAGYSKWGIHLKITLFPLQRVQADESFSDFLSQL